MQLTSKILKISPIESVGVWHQNKLDIIYLWGHGNVYSNFEGAFWEFLKLIWRVKKKRNLYVDSAVSLLSAVYI